ncbi:MAG: hypothetical protein IJ214_08700 [Clostridia bacterium]|nr:hypothetical protein [Clostridia bacterium]
MKYQPKNAKSAILIVVVVLVLIFAARFFGIGTTRSAMRIGYIGNDGSQREWSASYLRLSGSLEHTIRPESNAGKLYFEIKTNSGTISVVVQDKSGNIVFEKDNIETSTFEVEVPGEVRVCMKADGHRGGFKIRTAE